MSKLAERVDTLAYELGARIAVAESLTGGLLVAALISPPGASRVISGGIVAYDTSLKRSLLGVDATLLVQKGPVDAEVAKQMARGVREACAIDGNSASIGVSTTGVAGPDSDPQTGQPVGTVWVGLSSSKGERAIALQLTGDRSAIRSATIEAALSELIVELSPE